MKRQSVCGPLSGFSMPILLVLPQQWQEGGGVALTLHRQVGRILLGNSAACRKRRTQRDLIALIGPFGNVACGSRSCENGVPRLQSVLRKRSFSTEWADFRHWPRSRACLSPASGPHPCRPSDVAPYLFSIKKTVKAARLLTCVNADIRLFTIKWSSPHIRCVPVMIS